MSANRLTDEQVAEINNTMWSRWESMHHLGSNELGDLMRDEMLDAGHAWAQVGMLGRAVSLLRCALQKARPCIEAVVTSNVEDAAAECRALQNLDETLAATAGLVRDLCHGCGQEIDPDVCGCGDDEQSHSIWSGHPFIPMGCDCYRHGGAK